MILTLIFVGLIVLGIILMVLYYNDVFPYSVDDLMLSFGFIVLLIGMLGGIIVATFLIGGHCAVNKQIYNAKMEREAIVKQIECVDGMDNESVSKTTVISNVYKWNKKVYSAQYWSENPWTSWFWDKDYVNSLEYIDMEE